MLWDKETWEKEREAPAFTGDLDFSPRRYADLNAGLVGDINAPNRCERNEMLLSALSAGVIGGFMGRVEDWELKEEAFRYKTVSCGDLDNDAGD